MQKRIIEALSKRVENGAYARKLGIHLVELAPGHAVVEMNPLNDNMNIFGTTHGGAIFSLLDEAFQASCNSHGTVAVALSVTVNYHQPPDGNSKLRAESNEVHRSRKTATYEIVVTDEKNALIASCLAMAYRKRGKLPFLEEE
jgi:acyl-CoA thioesterase